MSEYLFYSDKYCHLCLENKTKDYICEDCDDRLEKIYGFRALEHGNCYYPLFYNNYIKNIIQKYKFQSDTFLVKPLTEILVKFLKNNKIEFDYITYIPMYKRDEFKRGYNQTKILAKEISKILNKELISLCEKDISTKNQNKLARSKRLNNLSGSFKFVYYKSLENLNFSKILVIDDVVTTGSTFNAFSKVVKENLNVELIFLAITSSKIEE